MCRHAAPVATPVDCVRSGPAYPALDVGMPRLNGLDATRRIRAAEWGGAVHIVSLTGWGQEQDRRNSAEAGANGHLVKPVAADTVFRLLAELPVTR